MSTLGLLVLFVVLFLFCGLALNVNMMTAMGTAAVTLFFICAPNKLNIIASSAYASMDSFTLLAIPFFMIAGTVMEHSGISRKLINWISMLVGRIRGAMGAITTVACMAFGVLTGSAMATISAIGKMMFPVLVDRGYRKEYASALIAATCFLGILIPPSIPGILYACASNQSVSDVWASTIIPGFMFGLSYILYNALSPKAGRHDIAQKTVGVPFGDRMKQFAKSTVDAFPSLLMPIIIFGGIYGGIFTATEAGAVCVVYGTFYYFYKKLRKSPEITSNFYRIMIVGLVSTASICIIQAIAATANRAISMAGVSTALAEFMTTHISSKWTFLIMCNIIFLILGMLMDIASAVVIATPLLLPTALAYGLHPVHFGCIMLVNLSVGFMTPPVAGGVFVSAKVTGVDFLTVVKETVPFLLIGLGITAAVTIFPGISLAFVK